MAKNTKKRPAQGNLTEKKPSYDYSQILLGVTMEQLIRIEAQKPSAGIRSLFEMPAYVENFYSADGLTMICPKGYALVFRTDSPRFPR